MTEETRAVAAAAGSRAGVLERATAVMNAFRLDSQVLLLDEVVAATGLPRSTTFRILRQLVTLGWLDHGPGGYRVGALWQGLDERALCTSDEVRSAAAPLLNDLHLATGGVVHLGVLEGDSVHYLDKVGARVGSRIPTAVGARIRASHTVIGRAMLAERSAEDVDELLRPSPEDHGRLHGALDRVRRARGIAVVDTRQCPLGLVSMGVAVPGPEAARAGLSVSGVDLDHTTVTRLVGASRRISQALFPAWNRTPPRAPSPVRPCSAI